MRGVFLNVNRIVRVILHTLLSMDVVSVKSFLQFADVNYEYCQKFRIV